MTCYSIVNVGTPLNITRAQLALQPSVEQYEGTNCEVQARLGYCQLGKAPYIGTNPAKTVGQGPWPSERYVTVKYQAT